MAAEQPRKPRVAAILTWYTVGSHSDVLVGKFLPGRGIPSDDGDTAHTAPLTPPPTGAVPACYCGQGTVPAAPGPVPLTFTTALNAQGHRLHTQTPASYIPSRPPPPRNAQHHA